MTCEKAWCAFITLDLKNAFNAARWGIVVRKFKNIRGSYYLVDIIRNYSCGRTVEIRGGNSIGISEGVTQGSILGQTL